MPQSPSTGLPPLQLMLQSQFNPNRATEVLLHAASRRQQSQEDEIKSFLLPIGCATLDQWFNLFEPPFP